MIVWTWSHEGLALCFGTGGGAIDDGNELAEDGAKDGNALSDNVSGANKSLELPSRTLLGQSISPSAEIPHIKSKASSYDAQVE